jgi:hypothetical protein
VRAPSESPAAAPPPPALALGLLLLAGGWSCGGGGDGREDQAAAPDPSAERPSGSGTSPPEAPSGAGSSTVVDSAPGGPPFPLAGLAAFDLALRPGGAWLIHGVPRDPDAEGEGDGPGGGLRAVPLDPRGAPDGPPVALSREGHVVEVAAASAGGQLVVGWIAAAPGGGARDPGAGPPEAPGGAPGAGEAGPLPHRVYATGGARGTFGPPRDLGPTAAPPTPGRRGGLALAFAPGRRGPTLYHRGPPTSCSAGRPPGAAPDCIGILRRRLSPSGTPEADQERDGVDLALPAPCAVTLPGLVRIGSSWFYGLCDAAGGDPETALYAIQLEPRYARADPVLRGCQPVDLLSLGGLALLGGDCPEASPGMRTWVEARPGGDPARPLGQSRTEMRCHAGRPVLGLPGVGRSLALAEPREGIGALVPGASRSDGRAVWTGEAILVARPEPGGASLVLEARGCAPPR